MLRRIQVALLFVLAVGCKKQQGPNVPHLQGPLACTTGVSYDFSASAVHPLGDDVCLQFEWGSTVGDWGDPVRSGETCTVTHIFHSAGTCRVTARAKDSKDLMSGWSSPLVVSVVATHGGPPTGVAVCSGPGDSDSTVVVAWTAPAEGTPDKYIVRFRSVLDSGYSILGETTQTSYVHNPHGMTGHYQVTAGFGSYTYDAAVEPTTVPVHSAAATLFEINVDPSRCGFGWTRDSGIGNVFAMTDSANCSSVDFYISDLDTGHGHEPIAVVSPNKADSIDPGAIGIVLPAFWRMNGFSYPLPDPQSPLPGYQSGPNWNYFIYTQISSQPCYISCYTAGEVQKHYALIQVDSVDAARGRVWVESWYQLVPGLRLIRH